MPIQSLLSPSLGVYLQDLLRERQKMFRPGDDRGEVGGSFSYLPPPVVPPNGMILSSPLPGTAPTLNNVLQGTFTLPGNRGIQTQLLRMLGNLLTPNSNAATRMFGQVPPPPFERFP